MDKPPVQQHFRSLILVPAVITLAVTLLRLVGELNHWSAALFSREAGGAGALVGIVWLIPILGIYFAIKLDRMGYGPATHGRAIGFAVASVVAFVVLVFGAFGLQLRPPVSIVWINLACALSAAVAYRGWPDLAKTAIAYGVTARIPVAVVMLVAMIANWGTHYELGPPDLPEMSVVPKWLWIGLFPQMVFWIGFTVIVGSLFGSLSLLVARRRA